MRLVILTGVLVIAQAMEAATIDRVALVVGKTVFTESEVDDEARLTEFEAGQPLDLSAAQRKQAAERMVDRELLRQEMTGSAFTGSAADSAALLQSFRQRRFPSVAQYRAALTRYGITEDELKQRLVWEAALLRFTDERFKPFAMPAGQETANRAENPAEVPASAVDQQMDAWLAQQRANTRVVFVPEAFR